jgi:thiamine biosynthesis lipoprotein
MGTRVRVVLYAESRPHAEAAARAAFDVMRDVNARLSDYLPESELSRLSSAAGRGPVAVSAPLFDILGTSLEHSKASDGSFDVTLGPLIRLWRRSRRSGALPDAAELDAARDRSGHARLRLDPKARTAELLVPGMLLDLGGIAKGYACDRALAAMRSRGITRAFVDTGGGMALGDPPPGKDGWTIGLLGDPRRVLVLSNCGVATSGDSEQAVEIGGVRYSHIVDPATGLGLTRGEMATVIAPTGMDADALATACCVRGPERALELIASKPGTEAWVQCVADRRRKRVESPGFAALTRPAED